MKRIVLLLIGSVFCATTLFGKNLAKEYAKMIARYDIPSSVVESANDEDFWNGVRRNSKNLAEYYKAVTKKKRAAREAHKRIIEGYALNELYLESFDIISSDSILLWLYNDLGIESIYPDLKLFIIEDSEPNAFTIPDGRIYIHTGLLSLEGFNYNMLLGVCAHECAHFLLLHSLVGTYQAVKREIRNNAIAAITAGVNIAANGFAAGNGVQVDWDNVNQSSFNLAKSAQVDAKRFRYRYSREQEVEADIIAYRFLQHAGIGGRVFIDFLELIQESDQSEWFYTDESDHPTTKYRIDLLNFLDVGAEP